MALPTNEALAVRQALLLALAHLNLEHLVSIGCRWERCMNVGPQLGL